MTRQQIADALDEMGTLLELLGANKFKCIAFHNGSRTIGALGGDLAAMIDSGEIHEIKGIGKGLADIIIEAVTTGKIAEHAKLLKSVPPGLLEMMRLQGLGPKRIKILHDKLKIKDIAGLKKAVEAHKLASLDGFGEKTELNILQSIERLSKHADKHLYSHARTAADRILEALGELPGVVQCEVAGSLRRRKETIGDIDILVAAKTKDAPKIMKRFTTLDDVESVVANGATKSSILLKSGIPCDLRIITPEEYPFALNYFTGSKEHNVEMRSRARRSGWSLNEYSFSHVDDAATKKKRLPHCESEQEIYAALKLDFVPPELRENMGEFEAAAGHTLPELITQEDLKGTFHCHTTYSDGTNTLEEMAAAAKSLGWEYLASPTTARSRPTLGGSHRRA